ncbi:MAG: hypothetical protein J6Y28_09800 [Acholeplasmatales bacterium]|nr:hypothetical protein [Methanobrevibacter sp.]MBP5446452.1 hypothetical protein [Acholeplasmatales bacterium]
MNKIYTITTEGCESCYRLEKLINAALGLTKKEVEVVFEDVKSVDKNWLKRNNVTDFPTTFLIKDNSIKFKFIGTRPAIIIARWIDVRL